TVASDERAPRCANGTTAGCRQQEACPRANRPSACRRCHEWQRPRMIVARIAASRLALRSPAGGVNERRATSALPSSTARAARAPPRRIVPHARWSRSRIAAGERDGGRNDVPRPPYIYAATTSRTAAAPRRGASAPGERTACAVPPPPRDALHSRARMRPAVRHALALLVVALAAAARAAADVDPLAVLDGYSLFARDKLLASTLHLANGNLGVSRGPLLCTGTLDAESSVVVATKVALAPRTSVCDTLIANRVRTDAADCSVADGFHAPLVPDLRAACRFPAPFPACDRAKPIAVRRGETVTLPPGVYGAVGSRRKPAAGTLVLGGRGRFVFCDVTMARKAALVVTEPAEVDVAGNAALGFVQFTGVAGPALDPDGRRVPGVPTELRFFVGGRSVRIGTAASLPHLCAPAATLGVARGATLEGSFVARVVDVRHVAGTVAISSTPRCGDATPDAEEECDDGNNVDGDGCESDCTLPACGDGVLEDDEECDDGNDQDGDGCESDCTLPFCGNGVVDPGEACDDGNDDGDDDCEPDCTPTPAPPVCGDGQADPDA